MGVNEWLQAYATETGSVYLDYYSALVAGRALKKEYTTDGFLLKDTAYAVMTPLTSQAIAQALGKK